MHQVRQENLPFVERSGEWRVVSKETENAGLPGQRRAAPPALRVLSTKHPALTRWAKVCRAYGASTRAPTLPANERRRRVTL